MRQVSYPLSASNTHLNELSSTPQPAGTDKFENVTVSGNYAYMSCGATSPTIAVYNVSNPLSPVNTFNINAAGTYGCVVQGDYIYWGGSGSTDVYIASIVPNVGILSTYNLLAASGACYSVAVDPSGNYLYVATQSKGLTVLSIASNLTMAEVFQEGGTTNKSFGVCLGPANILFTTNYDTAGTHVVKYLKTWNISTPSAPTLLNTYTFTSNAKPYGVATFSNLAFVPDATSNAIFVVDITNPSSPSQISSLQASATLQPGGNAAISTLANGKVYAYVGSGGNATKGAAIDCYDITTPASPVLIQTVWSNVANSAGGPVTIANGLIYTANYGVAPGNAGTLNIYDSTTAYSSPIMCRNIDSVSALLNVSDASTFAEISLQASNDLPSNTPTNFSDIPSTVMTVTNDNGLVLVPETDLAYEWVRLAYSTLGSGSVSGTLKALGG